MNISLASLPAHWVYLVEDCLCTVKSCMCFCSHSYTIMKLLW